MTPAPDTLPALMSFSLLDLLALALFAALWFGYGWLADYSMIAVTLCVVYVLHQREFRSRTLEALEPK